MVVPLGLFLLALAYRLTFAAPPFWVDEFSTASQALEYLAHGWGIFNFGGFIEHHNVTTYSLVALAFSFFGVSEWSARLPSMIIGALVPVVVYMVGKDLYSKRVGFAASILTIFSYLEITWSRQARGYVLQQLLVLIFLGIVYRFSQSTERRVRLKLFVVGVIVALLGMLTHSFFIFPIIASVIFLLFFSRKLFSDIFWNPRAMAALTGSAVILLIFTPVLDRIRSSLSSGVFGLTNNLAYYHSYLWREHGVITLLAILGFLVGFHTYRRATTLLAIHGLVMIAFVTFFVGATDTRYLLLFFPWVFFLTGSVMLDAFGSLFSSLAPIRNIILTAVVAFLILNGDVFVTKPKPYYSVNHDFREIALIDYHQIYARIREKGMLEEGRTAVIDTWPDRLSWYLGKGFAHGFVFRWLDAGPMKRTAVFPDGGYDREVSSGLRFIGNLETFQRVQAEYPQGFIFIDDSTLPRDVVDYVEQNLRRELYVDHYFLDDNPYSLWPANLYSWGFGDETNGK